MAKEQGAGRMGKEIVIAGSAVLSAALVAGVLASTWMRAGEMPAPEARGSAEAAAPSPAKGAGRAGDPGGGANDGEGPRRRALEGGDGPGAGEIEVLVLGPEGETVAGAGVRALAGAGPEDLRTLRDLGAVDRWMEERAPRLVPDPGGRWWIEAPAEAPTLLVGAAAGLWGATVVGPGDESPIELVLARDATLRARVVDEEGRPLPGTRVGLRAWYPTWDHFFREAEAVPPEAIATFPHAQEVLDLEGLRWSLVAMAVADPAIERLLDPRNLSGEIATLVLPPIGSVAVKVLDEGGEPLGEGARVSLCVVREGDPPVRPRSESLPRLRLDLPAEGGRAVFPRVALRVELAVEAWREPPGLLAGATDTVATRVRGPGPRRAGETVTFTIRLGADHPVARLRVIDRDGAPREGVQVVANVGIRAGQDGEEVCESSTPAVTAEDGGFLVPLASGGTERGIRRITVREGWFRPEPRARATIEVERALPAGITDLGALVLEPPAAFAEGRVVGERGEPVAGAEIALHRWDAGRSAWDTEPNVHRVPIDPDGAFAIHESFPGERFRLVASAPGRYGIPREFAPGARGLVLELRAGGEIAGTVLLDPEIPAKAVGVRLTSAPSTLLHLRSIDAWTADLAPDGAFCFSGLEPGLYGLEIAPALASGVFLELEDLLVHAGETTRDPRVFPLDLRGALHHHRMTLLAHRAGPELRGEIRFGPAGAEELEEWCLLHGSEVGLLTGYRSVDAEIRPDGYRLERLFGLSGKAEVALRPALRVRLALAGGIPLPDPPLFLQAVLIPDSDRRGSDPYPGWNAPSFGPSREVVLPVLEPDRMRVEWMVEEHAGGRVQRRSPRLFLGQIVDVLDVESEQRVDAILAATDVGELSKRLR
ncbi:MAG: carboxypeptidase-like regulatory domain-containing protein [Planctomycetota bacterium]